MPRLSIAMLVPALLALAWLLPPPGSPGAAEAPVYRQPPPVVAAVLTAPRVPRAAPSVSPDRTRMLLFDQPSLIPIATLAEPVEKLAGLEIVTSLRARRSTLKVAPSGFAIVTIADVKKVRAALPRGARLGEIAWSTSGAQLACAVHGEGGAELWIVDAATGAARRIEGVRLAVLTDNRLEWTHDDRAVLCATVPSGQAAPGEPTRVPEGPQVRVGAGKPTPQRTARDVLRTPDDQARFAWYLTAQLARVPVDGGAAQPIGAPLVLGSWMLSPDERHLLVTRLPASPPVGFPFYLFPHEIEIWGADGRRLATLGTVPLNDRSAISSVAPLGPRKPEWSPDGRAIFFFSWQDTPGADPVRAIRDTTLAQPGTDRLMRLDEPFAREAREVMRSDHQLTGIWWTTEGSRLIFHEEYQPRRRVQTGWIQPFAAAPAREIRVVRSTESVRGDPGRPLLRRLRHQARAWTTADGAGLYLAGDGFRADGQRPFLDRMDLASARTTRLYESAASHLEPVTSLLDGDGKRFITLRQSNREAPNYFVRKSGERLGRRLSDYSDPAPRSPRRSAFSSSSRARTRCG